MRKSRFSDHQILSILNQAEAGTSKPNMNSRRTHRETTWQCGVACSETSWHPGIGMAVWTGSGSRNRLEIA